MEWDTLTHAILHQHLTLPLKMNSFIKRSSVQEKEHHPRLQDNITAITVHFYATRLFLAVLHWSWISVLHGASHYSGGKKPYNHSFQKNLEHHVFIECTVLSSSKVIKHMLKQNFQLPNDEQCWKIRITTQGPIWCMPRKDGHQHGSPQMTLIWYYLTNSNKCVYVR